MKNSFKVMSIVYIYLFVSLFTTWILFTYYLSKQDSEILLWIGLVNGSLLAAALIMKNQTFGRIYVSSEGVIMRCFWVTIHQISWDDIISFGAVQLAGIYSLQIVYFKAKNDSQSEQSMRFEYNRRALQVLERNCPISNIKSEITRLRTTKWWK